MITIHVPAMTARQDVRAISARISDVPGVQTLKADLATGTVQVKGSVALAAVTAAVTAAGYAVTSATDDPPASAACHRPWLFGRGDHGRPPRAWVAPTHLRAGRNGPKPARPGEVMTGSPNDLGTHTWVERTGGLLTAAERRSLLRPLASAQVINVVGRLSMLVGVNTGRRAVVPAGRLRPPDSVLTRSTVQGPISGLPPSPASERLCGRATPTNGSTSRLCLALPGHAPGSCVPSGQGAARGLDMDRAGIVSATMCDTFDPRSEEDGPLRTVADRSASAPGVHFGRTLRRLVSPERRRHRLCRTSSPQVGTGDGEVEGDDTDTHTLVPKKRRSRGHVAATPGYLLPSHEVGCHCCRDDDVGTGRAKCQGHGCRGRR